MNAITAATMSLARSRKGQWGIFVASLAESTFVPIPLETIMVPMLLANRERIWWIATITTLGCMVGALVGYGVGYFAFETVGQWLIQTLDATDMFRSFQERFDAHGFWLVFSVGVTPVPFQVATVGSGVVSYPLALFLLAATLARSIRYFGLALLVRLFGRRVAEVIKRHQTKAKVGFWVLVVIAVAVTASVYVR